jgi:hypothetical protein
VRKGALGVARYRLQVSFRQRWAGYLTLVLLIGLVGGLGLGAVSAARRTQSSFSVFLTSTNPPDLTVTLFGANANNPSSDPSYSPKLTNQIAHLAGVRDVKSGILLLAAPLRSDGSPRLLSTALAYPVASINGLFFTQDRIAVTQGRLANPRRPDEIMMTALAAHQLGFHLGQTIHYGIYAQDQQNLPGFGTAKVSPLIRLNAKLVGLGSLSSEVVEDDIDRIPTFITFTPALVREVLARSGHNVTDGAEIFSIQTDHGSADVAQVESEITALIPRHLISTVHATAPVVAKADLSIKPIGIALGVFGGIALLAAILIATQSISRRLRLGGGETAILRALGADPKMVLADSLLGIAVAIVLGALMAVAIAVALSTLSPLGPVRSVYPSPGIAVDWTVSGFGLLLLIGGLGLVAGALAYRGAPHRTEQRIRISGHRRSRVVRAASAAGLPTAGVVGVRMALESGGARTAVPVRSALLGTALAIALVVATVTFGSSLRTLVSQPSLYGWNWTYMLSQVGSGGGNVPPQAFTLLAHDSDVAAYSGISYFDGEIDGQGVPFLIGTPHARVAPPILSGHAVDKKDQIVLGGATLTALHKKLGDTVRFTFGASKNAPFYVPPTRLTIVGISTMPAVGFASSISDHTSMGTGALLSANSLPKAFLQGMDSPDPTLNGPNLALVRMRHGVSSTAGRDNLQRIADDANRDFAAVPDGGGAGDTIAVVGVQRPAEIVNYRTIGVTPTLLVSGLALGAVTALALTLVASVRQRRRDLALLKTLGFTQRQLAATVAWQSSVNAVTGLVLGIPIGVVVGRWLWVLFARQIYAVPEPSVPVLSLCLIAVGTLILANVVATVPGRIASRVPTALLLRAE